tara:strand:+ start:4284 stop:5162 length:879 start_codon:yes stop_codon:yes gene_type:complete
LNKVLIFGIDSFTGIHLKNLFIKNNISVVGTSLTKTEDNFKCDLTKINDVINVLSLSNPSYIINLSAISYTDFDDYINYYNVNVLGVENIFTALNKLKINPKKIILSSSASVYGNNPSQLSETSELNPISHYGLSKLTMEKLCYNYFQDFNIIITRPFNYTGLGQNEIFIIPKLINHFKNRSKKIRLGNINVFREFNNIDFVIEAYYQLLFSNQKSEIFNICSGNFYSIKNVIEILKKIMNHDIELILDKNYFRKNEIAKLYGNPSKLFLHFPSLKEKVFDIKEILLSMIKL